MAIQGLTETQIQMLNNMCISAQNVQMGTLMNAMIKAINSGGGSSGEGTASKEYVEEYIKSLKRVESVTTKDNTFIVEGYVCSVELVDSVTGERIIGECYYVSSEEETEVKVILSDYPPNPITVNIIYIPYKSPEY